MITLSSFAATKIFYYHEAHEGYEENELTTPFAMGELHLSNSNSPLIKGDHGGCKKLCYKSQCYKFVVQIKIVNFKVVL